MSVISNLSVRIGADVEEFSRGLESAQRSIENAFDTSPVENMSEAVGSINGDIEGLAGSFTKLAGTAAGLFGLSSAIGSAVDMGSDLVDMSRQLHTSVAETENLYKILRLTDTDATALSTSMLRLQKTYNTSGAAADTLKQTLDAVGISITDSSGAFLDVNTQLKNLAEGYKVAKEAGIEQEFLMNTLGIRGQALVNVLEQYEEAAEQASQVKTIGLNPEQLENLGDSLTALKMQAEQFEIALANAFVPLAEKILPLVMNELQYLAGVFNEHKELIATVTEETLKLYAAYKTFTTLQTTFTWLSEAWVKAKVALGGYTSAVVSSETTITAEQEKQLSQRLKAIDGFYAKKIKQAQAAAAKISADDAEAVAKMMADIERLQIAHTKAVADVTAKWKAGLTEVTVAHNTMAVDGVAANERVAASARVAAGAQAALGTAATAAGTEVVAASAAGVGAMGRLGVAVGNVSKAVMGLIGGWAGLIAIIGYAGYQFISWQKDLAAKREQNTITLSSTGHGSKNAAGSYTKDEKGNWHSNRYGEAHKTVSDEALINTLEAHWYEKNQKAADLEAAAKKAEADEAAAKAANEAKKRAEELAEAMRSMTEQTASSASKTSGGSTSKDTSSKQAKTYEVDSAIGNKVVEKAMAHAGEVWGKNTCASFVTAAMKEAGVNVDGFGGSLVKSLVDQAGNAYHEAGTYTPNAGDLVVWKNDNQTDGNPYMHVGISDGQGGHYASNTSTGITHVTSSMGGDSDYYGAGYYVGGYISMSELSGNQTYKKTVSEDDKKATEELNKRAKAQSEVNRLTVEAGKYLLESGQTEYEKELATIQNERAEKLQRLQELKNEGADITAAKIVVDNEAEAKISELQERYRQANADAVNESELAWLSAEKKYAEYEDKRYQYTLANFERIAEVKRKEMVTSQDDAESVVAWGRWRSAELEKIELAHLEKVKEIARREREARLSTTNIEDLIVYLNSSENLLEAHSESQKAFAEKVRNAWKDSYIDMEKLEGELFSTMNNSMSNSISSWIRGTKSASEAFADLANSVLDMLAQMIAKAIAFNIVMSIFKGSGLFGGVTTSTATVTAPTPGVGLSKTLPYAQGGLISGPGTGTSDSILAYHENSGEFIRLSDGEFVMTAEATKNNLPLLEAMNNGLRSYAEGGIISPQVRSYSRAEHVANASNGGNCNIQINLRNESGTEVKAETTGKTWDGEQWVIGVVLKAVSNNQNGIRNVLKGVAST